MLTPTDRNWLTHQRELLLSASAKADTYGHALTYDTPGRAWRLFRAWKIRRQRAQLTRLRDVWAAEAARRAIAIQTWIEVYKITRGPDRGPTPIIPERDVWHSDSLKRTL